MVWVLNVTIQSNRTLGLLGACFTLVGAVSTALSLFRYLYPTSLAADLAVSAVAGAVGVLAFVGFILFLVAMYGFSRDYGERRIFNYVLYGLLIGIVAAIVAVIAIFAVFFAYLASILPSFSSSSLPSSSQIQSLLLPYSAPFLAVFGFIALINIVLDVLAFNLLGGKSGVPMFRTAAKVLLSGGLLMAVSGVVFGVFAYVNLITYDQLSLMVLPGAVVQEIAWLLLAVAFFRIQPPPAQATVPPTIGR
jgi:uncharacterized membrane protein